MRDPEGSTYSTSKQIQTTAAQQMADENSLYNYYCRLLSIRHKYPAIARGSYTAVGTGEKNLGGFLISYEGETLLLLHNNGTAELTVDLSSCKDLSGFTVQALCDYIGCSQAKLEGTTLTIAPQTSVILK